MFDVAEGMSFELEVTGNASDGAIGKVGKMEYIDYG